MNRKQYAWCGIALTMLVGAAVGWSVTTGNYVLPVVVVIAAMVLKILCKRRVTEVLEDELVYRLAEKASYSALRVGLLAFAVIAAVLVALSRNGPAAFVQIGLTLAFAVCALLILQLSFYAYYSAKGLDH
jgi:uncharacterized membrane protein